MDHYARADRNQRPNLADLGVGDGNAAYGPVLARVSVEEFAQSIGLTMDEDVTARRRARCRRPRLVLAFGIGHAQRQVKGTVGVARIDRVAALGRAAVTFSLLVPVGREAQRHAISFKHLA